MMYLLAQSHLSIHTFVDEGKLTLDLFTYSFDVENKLVSYKIILKQTH
jgi:S-adenosylmethionine/arginine decarboxylase-like enzyme